MGMLRSSFLILAIFLLYVLETEVRLLLFGGWTQAPS